MEEDLDRWFIREIVAHEAALMAADYLPTRIHLKM
jgi:hypothetical protein